MPGEPTSRAGGGIFKRAARNALLSFVDLVPIVKRQIEVNLSGLSRANLAHLPD